MTKIEGKKTTINPADWLTPGGGRGEVILGVNHDETTSTLPAYAKASDGAQVHPDRLSVYEERLKSQK